MFKYQVTLYVEQAQQTTLHVALEYFNIFYTYMHVYIPCYAPIPFKFETYMYVHVG